MTKQRLAAMRPTQGGPAAIVALLRDLGYVQWDPVAIVAPSHLLTLWSRLGKFRPTDLERVLWNDRTAFEHWMPMASLVLTEDYPLYASLMRRYPASLTRSWGNQRERARRFLARNADLRRRVLLRLRGGPRTTVEFDEHDRTKRRAEDWGFSSDLTQMLYHLCMTGEVMVVGHRGNLNLWGLSSDFLPEATRGEPLSPEAFERAAAERALRALGTATAREITLYFVRGRYENLGRTLRQLSTEGAIQRVEVENGPPREERFVRRLDLPLLERLERSPEEPRVALLPPFDNLLFSGDRLRRLFGFDYVREQFLPPAKRRYGTYVLPILRGDRLIGRVDPQLDKASGTLDIHAVHAEPGAPGGAGVAEEIGAEISRLGQFLGADRVRYSPRVPPIWKALLR
ncbi:MAG TPA: crosslink repair DNA glycosylase YcaQ family protein [Thermoplasmata archaeon]|nr:crosslink repair DNA glycosylase YcaQ family protein [Thermoplasmata archaeon]